MPAVMPVSLRQVGEWLLFGLLFAILGFQIVRGAGEMLLSSCPAADTISERAAAREACPDDGR